MDQLEQDTPEYDAPAVEDLSVDDGPASVQAGGPITGVQ
jgi:hypothetical protein